MIKTGYVSPQRSYSQGAWEGVNQHLNLTTKEIAKLVRKELKELYPKNKYSITTEYNHIYIALMKTDTSPFENLDNLNFDVLSHKYNYGYSVAEEVRANFQNTIDTGYYQVNHYHIESRDILSKESKKHWTTIKELLNSFNYDDSDSMTDYFSSGFYVDLSIGKWDKKLEVI